MKRFAAAALFAMTAFCTVAQAATEDETRAAMEKAVEAAQRQLQLTFTGVKPSYIGEAPVKGLYEILIGNNLIYYAPEANMLLFGEFYTSDGISATQERLSELKAAKLKDLPLDKAIKIGNGPNQIIEFTDLDCPFCRAWEQYAAQRDDITRYVFLMPVDSLHPQARAKSIHALCSDKPGEVIGGFLQGRIGTDRLVQCDRGKSLLKVHEAAARRVEVTGTPTLVINGTLVAGFNKSRIETLLTKR